MNKAFDYTNLSKLSNWNFNPTMAEAGADWKGNDTSNKHQTYIPSNVNALLDNLKWMHLVCVFLLFGAQLSFVNRSGTAINFSSVLKIVTVPYYFFMIFNVESTIR